MNVHQQMFIWSYHYYLVKDVKHNVEDEHWRRSDVSHIDSTGSRLLIWNPGHHEVKYFPLFNHTQYPCIFSFKHFLSLVLDCSPSNRGVTKVLEQRSARKLCWKAWGVNPSPGVLVLRCEGMAMEGFKLQAKPCQFCIVFSKELSSGKGCQTLKTQVETLCSRGIF